MSDTRVDERHDLGWKGEPPAEGTRRKLILDTIDRKMSGPANLHLEIADEIEEALIAYGADAEDRRDQLRYAVPASERRAADKPPNGSPRRERIFDVVLRHQARLTSSHGGCLTRGNALDLADQIDVELTDDDSTVAVLDVLDSLEIPWRRGEECLGLGERATILGDRYTEARRKLRSQEATIAGFAETIAAQAPFVGRTDEWVQGLVMAAITAGQESDVPFPADVVDSLLADFGIKPTLPRQWPTRGDVAATDEAEPPTEAEAAGQVWEKGSPERRRVEARVEQARVMAEAPEREEELLAQREEARGGEDRFKAERDAALHLLRWLIGDLIPPELVEISGLTEGSG